MSMWIQRACLVSILFGVVLLGLAPQNAQAGIWWSPNGYSWTVEAICPDGIELVSAMLVGAETPKLAANWANPTFDFIAYFTSSAPKNPTKALTPPAGSDTVDLGRKIGGASLTVAVQPKAMVWTNDELGTAGKSYLYGRAKLTWNPLFAKTLPLGTPVAVHNGGTSYFIGQVNACAQALGGSSLYLPAIQN